MHCNWHEKTTWLDSGGQKPICQPDTNNQEPSVELQSIKGLVNLTRSHVEGTANGSVIVIQNLNINYAVSGRPDQCNYPQPPPLRAPPPPPAPAHEKSRVDNGKSCQKKSLEAKLVNANPNGHLLRSSSSPSTDSSSSLSRRCNNSLPAVKHTCSVCKREFIVPINKGVHRCYACLNFTNSISGYEQSRVDSGAKLSKHDQQENANKNGSFPRSSSPSIGSSSSLSRRCNKRAVLCGVTYRKRKFKLKGTVNDVFNMKDLLVNHFQYPNECIRVLTEEQHDPNLIPKKRNILESLKWLVKDCQSTDSLVFYFSGHGVQQPEHHEEDEIDGLDETVCPVDFMKEGMITDNEINSIIVRPLPNGVTLHAIVDACHSGTTLDLMYVYKQENGICQWEDNKLHGKEPPIRKHTSGGQVICLSACKDNQKAADTTAFGGKGMNGVMTYLLTKTIRDRREITYGDLLETMYHKIENIHQTKCYNSMAKHFFLRKVKQDPILSSSDKFDVRTRKFTL